MRIAAAAASYQAYSQAAIGVKPDFTDGAGVAQSLRTAASYRSEDLMAGSIAYGAVIALQEPGFVASIRSLAVDPNGRRRVVASLLQDPAYATAIGGSDHAAGLIITALDANGKAVFDAGTQVKQAAYDIQRKPWSKAMVTDRPQRLLDIKASANSSPAGDLQTTTRLQRASTEAGLLTPKDGGALPAPYTTVVTRALAVAALAALGEASDKDDAAAWAIVTAPTGDNCLSMAKLNLYQCLAVAGPHYEDVFCMGQHALKDTGQCLIRNAGAPIDPAILAARAAEAATARAAAMRVPTLAEAQKAKPSKRSGKKRRG